MLENQDGSLEKQHNQPKSVQIQEMQNLLEQGKYIQAETLAQKAKLNPQEWDAVTNGSDDEIRQISDEPLPESPLSIEQSQKAMTEAEDKKSWEFAGGNDPEAQKVQAMEGIVIENDNLLQKLTDTIEDAKGQVDSNKWAKPVGFLALPVISDIYAIVKGKELRKSLRKLEDLNSQLQDPKVLNSKVDADTITPDKGHMATIAGHAVTAIGYGTVIGGGIAASPVAAGIGLGTMVAGGVTSLVGYIKQAINFSDMSKTKQTLVGLEKRINDAKNANNIAKMQVAIYRNSCVQGVRENVEKVMN